ncbi:MAG: hypothetical protein QOH55_1862 [Microbacteriaceae bacterium]|jgi:hypothetical protein|nr:hypothetical protein [Microbacteriaceae bacterium]
MESAAGRDHCLDANLARPLDPLSPNERNGTLLHAEGTNESKQGSAEGDTASGLAQEKRHQSPYRSFLLRLSVSPATAFCPGRSVGLR